MKEVVRSRCPDMPTLVAATLDDASARSVRPKVPVVSRRPITQASTNTTTTNPNSDVCVSVSPPQVAGGTYSPS